MALALDSPFGMQERLVRARDPGRALVVPEKGKHPSHHFDARDSSRLEVTVAMHEYQESTL